MLKKYYFILNIYVTFILNIYVIYYFAKISRKSLQKKAPKNQLSELKTQFITTKHITQVFHSSFTNEKIHY